MPLSEAERKARGEKAAAARWGAQYDWVGCDLNDGLKHLADLRKESEKGSMALERRMSDSPISKVECFNPNCYTKTANGQVAEPKKRTVIDVGSGRFAGMRSRISPETGLCETAYACSAACFLYLGQNFAHRSTRMDINQPVEPDVLLNEAAKNLTA